MTIVVPPPDRDPQYRQELLGFLQAKMDEHPRNKQRELGPSEIGGCPRGIAWKLHYGASDGKQVGWASSKGVVLHAWADEIFKEQSPRFLSDLKLPQVVPWVAGGTLDLYDTAPPPTVVDFKFFGDASITKARRGKPPESSWVQINTYALGLTKLGYPVERVALLVAPQCGDDLHGMNKGAVLLTWPFDPKVAVDALREIKRIKDMLAVAPVHKVMEVLPTKEDFCHMRECWTGNRHPDAICNGHRKGGATTRDPNDIFG